MSFAIKSMADLKALQALDSDDGTDETKETAIIANWVVQTITVAAQRLHKIVLFRVYMSMHFDGKDYAFVERVFTDHYTDKAYTGISCTIVAKDVYVENRDILITKAGVERVMRNVATRLEGVDSDYWSIVCDPKTQEVVEFRIDLDKRPPQEEEVKSDWVTVEDQ